jgi:hypothetical protein
LPWNSSFELSGFFTSRALFFGASIVEPYGTLDGALQKKFPKIRGALTLGCSNMLNTMVWRTSVNLPNQGIVNNATIHMMWPVFRIGWSQSFGNSSLKESRQRSTGGDEIKKRVQ